jgi:hypothetical protein
MRLPNPDPLWAPNRIPRLLNQSAPLLINGEMRLGNRSYWRTGSIASVQSQPAFLLIPQCCGTWNRETAKRRAAEVYNVSGQNNVARPGQFQAGTDQKVNNTNFLLAFIPCQWLSRYIILP